MSKRFVTVVIFSLLVFCTMTSPVVLANTNVQAVLFPVSILFNSEEREPGGDYAIINYKDHVYAPIRYIASNLYASAEYDAENETISIQSINPLPVKSEVTGVDEKDDFVLSIHSGKKEYRTDEFPTIWATLTYFGNEEITMKHNTPLIYIGIKDASSLDSPPSYHHII